MVVKEKEKIKHMIHLILGGGLGNQMFQYAFARYLSFKTGQQISFNTYLYQADINKDRDFSLGCFSIPNIHILGKTKSEQDFKYFMNQSRVNKYLKRIVPDYILARHLNSKGLYSSVKGPFKYFKPIVDKSVKELYVHGGFQSQKYFDEICDIIKEEFRFSSIMNDANKSVYDLINNSNSVCLHIRRGDYLSAEYKDTLAVCGKEYYESAMAYIESNINDPKFFVFSNTHEDLEWIKKNYKIPQNSFFVDLGNFDYSELQLMSSCKHFIMSNSSFSWWAQFLSQNDDKIVVAPSVWDKRKECDASDIYLPAFIRINSNGEIV